MEQPPGHNKAVFAPEYVGVQHVADFNSPEESTDQTGGFVNFGGRPTPEQRKHDRLIYFQATELGADFLEATGGAKLEPEHYKNLYEKDWVDYPFEEMVRILENEVDGDFEECWQAFQADILQAAKARNDERQAERERFLQEIEQAERSNNLPEKLFYKVEEIITPALSNKHLKKDGTYSIKPDTGIISNEKVSDDEKIIRYAKFKLAEHLLADTGASELKPLSLALGIVLANEEDDRGPLISNNRSYLSELKKSNEDITDERIDSAVNALRIYDYIFPEHQQELNKQLLQAGGYKPKAKLELVKVKTNASEQQPESIPKHYFDLTTGSVIEEQFLDYFLRSGANPERVRNLGMLLRDKDIVINRSRYPKPNLIKWDRERYKRYGKWLVGVVAMPENNREKIINVSVLRRARQLGLGPGFEGPGGIENQFDNVTNFYVESVIPEAHIRNNFDEWSIQDFVDYIIEVKDELGTGRFPVDEQLDELSNNNPNRPHSSVIREKTRHIGGLRKIQELAGKFITEFASNEDLFSWGVKFRIANEGMPPTQMALNYCSSRQSGPSEGVLRLREGIGSLTKYNEEVEVRYYKYVESRRAAANKIRRACKNHELPKGLVENNTPDEEVITRLAKFRTLELLAPNWPLSTKTIVSVDGVSGYDFISSIRLIDKNISIIEIESAALELNSHDEIWSNARNGRLKLGDDFDTFQRRVKDRKNEADKRRRSKKVLTSLS